MNQQSPQQQPSSLSQGSQQASLTPPQPALVSLWCPSCGAENRPNASFCTNCGAWLTPAPQLQLSQAQTQGKQHIPPRSQTPHPKNSRKMSTAERVALISTIGTIVVAIITAIIAPIIVAKVSSSPTPTPTPMPTAIPSLAATQTPQDIYNQVVSGNPVLNDPLTGQDANNWDVNSMKDSGCIFEGGAYHTISMQAGYYTPCLAEATNFSNLAFQAEMTVIKGSGGALLIRSGGAVPYGYRFYLGQNGMVVIYNDKTLTLSTAATAKLNQTYLLTVIARGSSMSLYIDKQWITTVEDNTISSGAIGLLAFQGEVVFKNAKVWTLSS